MLDLPDPGNAQAYALFAHCFTCSKNLKAVMSISRALTRREIAVFRFDFSGLGDSEGEFSETNLSSNIDDLDDAADFMREEIQAPSILIGHSLGGTAVLMAAERIPECRAVCTIAAPFDPAHVTAMFSNQREKIELAGEAQVKLAGRSFQIRQQLLDDLETSHASQHIARLKRPLLVLHSPLDQTVGIDHAARIFTAAKHPKSFVSLDGADHLISDPEDAAYIGEIISAWAGRYICTDS